MSTKKSTATKKAVQVKGGTHSKIEQSVLVLETGIPFPIRAFRDPEFIEKADALMRGMKISQSFVVPKERLHAVKRIAKINYESQLFKSTIIKPDLKFARVWRVK